MGGIETEYGDKDIFINNYGVINPSSRGRHFEGNNSYYFVFINYAMVITENASVFANSKGNTSGNNNSHIVISGSGGRMKFDNPNSKIILDFGGNFDFGVAYPLDKLIIDTGGNNKLNVDFDRLTTQSSLYKLTQSGDDFIVSIDAPNSEIGILHKTNIRTMNNFYLMSNAMIYPRKSYHSQNLGNKNSLQTDSAIPLKSYESFSYRNESVNRRIQRQNKRNYNRRLPNQRNTQNLNTDSANYSNSMRQTQNPHDYYFILTPFINHNLFFESGRYNLSGFDYGFLTAFSTQVAESNSLGAHFIFSYGNLGDSKDKDLSIKSLNLNVGINYKLDLVWDMYLKARGDFFYFSNTLDSLTIKNIKPNNLGFGVSVIFGKDFDFKQGGVLGIEVGLDYKGLQSSTISLQNNATKSISETYQKALYNLIYADVGVNYNKYFGGFGINIGTGFMANLAPKLAESALIINSQTLKFTLDNDKYLAYANAGISYLLNARNFDMEFSLAYYGNYGDRVISNGGGVEWRVMF